MAKRKRDSKGRFVSKGRGRRKTSRRRRTYRRNPKFKPVQTLTDGAVDALAAVLGKAAARAIPQQVGLPTSGTMGLATQAGVAIVVSMVADRVWGKKAAFVTAGALMAPIETAVRDMGVPVLSPALSSYPALPAAQHRLSDGRAGVGNDNNGLASYFSDGDPMMLGV